MESYLEEFVQVVDAGSVSAAARELGVPRASVSRRLAKLEASYGTQLLHRGSHRQTVTEAGNELYQRARRIVAAMDEAKRAVSQMDAVPRGVLRVGLPGSASLGMTLTQAYRRQYPEVEVEVVQSGSHADLLGDRIDVALVAGRIVDERLIARRVLSFDTLVFGSPEFLSAGVPTLETLPDVDCIVGLDDAGRPLTEWPLWNGGTVEVSGPVRTDGVDGQIEGARLGLGLALVPERGVERYVESGELVAVLVEEVGLATPVSLAWPQTDFLNPKVRAFVDLASNMLAAMESQPSTCA